MGGSGVPGPNPAPRWGNMNKSQIRPIVVQTCPICGESLALSAISETLDFTNSGFWGDLGFREIVHREGAHFHFRVIHPETGETADRYAFLVPVSRVQEGGTNV